LVVLFIFVLCVRNSSKYILRPVIFAVVGLLLGSDSLSELATEEVDEVGLDRLLVALPFLLLGLEVDLNLLEEFGLEFGGDKNSIVFPSSLPRP
tara:strand:+ start:342 stop:623 length:282 start_codon:yes stop_codon:yes gene_type:complete